MDEIRYEKHYVPIRYISHPLLFIGSFLLLQLSKVPMKDLNIGYIIKHIVNPGPIMTIGILGIIIAIATWIIFKRRLETRLEGYLNIMASALIVVTVRMQVEIEARIEGDGISIFTDPSDYFRFFSAVFGGLFLVFNVFYRAYGWDELEWERREKRREERLKHLWN
jgi:hypothetical protein